MKDDPSPLKLAVRFKHYKGLVLMISKTTGNLLHTYDKNYYEQNIKGKAESSLLDRVKAKMAIATGSLPDH
jgi:hypothetical protein